MHSQKKGSKFEIITKDFFVWLFNEIGLVVTKDRIQFSGTQNGFDIQFNISKQFINHIIFIECKNYSKDLASEQIMQKAIELESTYKLKAENDLFIAINKKTRFSNKNNPEKVTETLQNKFKFKIELLDINNGIKELFALNPLFYKELYHTEAPLNLDKDEIINRFKHILFSKKPLQTVIINTEDVSSYIGNIEKKSNYIERTYTTDKKKSNSIYSFFEENKLSLYDIINDNDKVIILGNPGLGKTTSLEDFTINNLRVGEQMGRTPIYKNLKNFTSSDSLETYLPKEFKNLKNILLILDGIDEIPNIEDFKSKFEEFIKNNNVIKNVKYLVSCRTNIYVSSIFEISKFKPFYLNNLTFHESRQILNKLTSREIDTNELNKVSSFISTPFQINILATYIIEKNEFPTNTTELWDIYINKRLREDKTGKLIKKRLDISLIKEYSKELSLINELMKTNVFEEDDLNQLFNKNFVSKKEFLKNPLIDKNLSDSNWFFEHRNIQEYFAALSLLELEYDKIIDFIVIPRTNKTHPSLFNVISFLINIIDENSNKYKKLLKWIIDNEPELLFHADDNRINDNIKVNVFKSYFNDVVIDKMLWLTTNKSFQIEELANFASCKENFDYLHNMLKDTKKYHVRVISTVIGLLNYFIIYDNEPLKKTLLKLLNMSEFNDEFKSSILRLIKTKKLCENR